MQTRKRGLIDCRNNLGLCISYDRSLAYFNWCCQYRVCKMFHWRDGLVCPPQAFSGVFTTAAVDNIDHNPRSTSAHGFFHDTALSLLQHPTHACPGIQRPATVVSENIQDRRSHLTTTSWIQCGQSYCAAHPDPMVPTAEHPLQAALQPVRQQDGSSRDNWLDDMTATFAKPELSDQDFVSWAAYYSRTQLEHFQS